MKNELRFTCKPIDLDEIIISVIDMDSDLLKGIKFTEEYILDFKCANIIPEDLQRKPFRCLGEDGNEYIIKPEGYSYVRYATRIAIPRKEIFVKRLDEGFKNQDKSIV